MRWKRFFKRHKTIIIISVIILIIILIFFGTQIILFFNFIIGNDVVVRLDADKEYFSLKHNQEEKINFEASVLTNPFCKAICRYDFYDISDDILVDSDEFTLNPTNPLNKEYQIKADKLGKGQDLYRFDMECISRNTILCRTGEEPSTRSILVAVDYDLNDEENVIKENTKEKLRFLTADIKDVEGKIKALRIDTNQLNEFLIVDDINKDVFDLENKNFELKINELIQLWKNYDYIELESKIIDMQNELDKFRVEISDLSVRLSNIIGSYNSTIEKVANSRNRLIALSNQYLDNKTFALNLSTSIKDFNQGIKAFENRTLIAEKHGIAEEIFRIVNSFENLTKSSIEFSEEDVEIHEIKDLSAKSIKISEKIPIELNIDFSDSLPECCVFGECKSCCVTEECVNDPNKYPVVFLHGHAFNKDVSAEYSLEAFNKIQQRLEDEGYLNAGAITLYTKTDAPYGYLSYADVPITLKTSYYFDVFHEPENYVIVQTKSENIDTYSIRLKELIDVIKYKTGKPKVKIIAFSMGGLVARRYVQIFEANDVETLILIGTPNKGIVGDITNYCPIIGENLECRDMNANSLFINKLNRDKSNVEIHNIIGTGCLMNGNKGDGIVLEENAYLEYASNYYINGTCSRIRPLHLDLLNIDLYPEVYDIIAKGLR